MKTKYKKSAIDLTDLAVGIVVLGIVVSIGAIILVNLRDARLTELTIATTSNETTTSGSTLTNFWVDSPSSVFEVINASSIQTVTSTNYTVTISDGGAATITLPTSSAWFNNSINVSYTWYNTTSNADWGLANDASIGLGEYGNWFDIIVIVGVAAVVLSLIFMAFGRRAGGDVGISY